MKMYKYTVEYTTAECVGNQTFSMEIQACDIDDAYGIMDTDYPERYINCIYTDFIPLAFA